MRYSRANVKLSGKKILVTGGAGFIGSHTTEALLSAGAAVTVFDNFPTGKKTNLPSSPSLRIVEGDIRDRSALTTGMQGIDAVMHLAAQVSVRVSVEDPVTSAEHNVTGFLNTLQAARELGVQRVVYASSAAVYGIPAQLPLDEESPLAPISPYGLEKQIDEQYARILSLLYDMSTLGLRYFNVYGPRQDPASPYAGVISKFADRIQCGATLSIFGDGLQTRDFVYVGDIAEVNVAALSSNHTAIVAVGTGRSVTLLDLVDTLAKSSGRTAHVKHDAPVAGDISQSAMQPRKLLQMLGMVPSTSLERGLTELLASFRQPVQ
jgi:UDP-glucose 4-epimerase